MLFAWSGAKGAVCRSCADDGVGGLNPVRCRGRGKLAVSWGWDILGWHCEQGEAWGEAAHVSVALILC